MLRNQILSYIRENRVSSVEVADALGKTGVLHGIKALNERLFVAAPVYYTCTWNESNWPLHEQVAAAPEDHIVFIDAIDCGERALFGDIVSKYLMLYRKARGLVVRGLVRDAHRLRKEGYPIWCTGVTPLGCTNAPSEADAAQRAEIERRRAQFDGALMVCDDSGVTVVPPAQFTEEFLAKLRFIELQEDIWYFCIDTLKMSTFDTICLKTYAADPAMLPAKLRDYLREQGR